MRYSKSNKRAMRYSKSSKSSFTLQSTSSTTSHGGWLYGVQTNTGIAAVFVKEKEGESRRWSIIR